jgi:hypothetical protein
MEIHEFVEVGSVPLLKLVIIPQVEYPSGKLLCRTLHEVGLVVDATCCLSHAPWEFFFFMGRVIRGHSHLRGGLTMYLL